MIAEFRRAKRDLHDLRAALSEVKDAVSAWLKEEEYPHRADGDAGQYQSWVRTGGAWRKLGETAFGNARDCAAAARELLEGYDEAEVWICVVGGDLDHEAVSLDSFPLEPAAKEFVESARGVGSTAYRRSTSGKWPRYIDSQFTEIEEAATAALAQRYQEGDAAPALSEIFIARLGSDPAFGVALDEVRLDDESTLGSLADEDADEILEKPRKWYSAEKIGKFIQREGGAAWQRIVRKDYAAGGPTATVLLECECHGGLCHCVEVG